MVDRARPAWAGGFVLAACIGLAGCPPRDEPVLITKGGAQKLLEACQPVAGGSCPVTGPEPSFEKPTQLRTLLVDLDGTIRARGECVPLNLCTSAECAADRLNDALDSSMRDGLTFDGLEDANDAVLMIALHQVEVADAGAGSRQCEREDFVACGIFGVPVGGADRTITCAACVGGSPAGAGCDTDQCPFESCSEQCVLQVCADVLDGG